jgi:hypothetical protein
VPYQLGYATKELAAAARFELAHPRLQDECSVSNWATPQFGGLGGIQTLTRSLQDFYAVGYITSPGYLSFDIGHFSFVIWSHAQLNLIAAGLQNQQWQNSNHQWKMIWLWVESNHQPRAYETLALIPFELHSP